MPIYASNTAEQCEFIIRDAGAKIVIVEDVAQRDKLLPLRDRLFTRHRRSCRWGRSEGGARRRFRSVAGDPARRRDGSWLEAHPGELDAHAETVSPDSMFTIVYTSGTTGTPKGVVLTHENLTSSVCSAVRAMQVNDGDEQYLFLPLAHILARQTIWVGFEAGYVTTVLARDGPDQGGPAGGAPDLHGRRAAHLREVLRRA